MQLRARTCKIDNLSNQIAVTNVFLKRNYLKLLSQYLKVNINYIVVENMENSHIVCVGMLIEKSMLKIPYIINPQMSYYQPIEFFLPPRKLPNETELKELEVAKELAKYYNQYYLKVDINLPPEISDVRGFLWEGMKASVNYTYRFELKDFSTDIMFRSQRKSYRKSLKQNYSFDDTPCIEEFLLLAKETALRQEWKINLDKNFVEFASSLIAEGVVKQFNIKNSSSALVASMFCYIDRDNKRVYAWLSGSRVSELSNGVSLYMFTEVINYLKDDYDVLDLCGANNETISRFKASLGAELKVFYKITF